MKKEIIESYNSKEKLIKKRLEDFKSLSEDEYYKEFLFCLLTPQSNAQRCWEAVEQLINTDDKNLNTVTNILSKKTRFHHTKAKRILNAEETWKNIEPLLHNPDKKELRNQVKEIVNGYGLKESSHFLRNIGHSNNQIAILDRHILRNLKAEGIIDQEKIKNEKNYLEIEQKYLDFAKSLSISPDALDLLWWSQENGEIFK